MSTLICVRIFFYQFIQSRVRVNFYCNDIWNCETNDWEWGSIDNLASSKSVFYIEEVLI